MTKEQTKRMLDLFCLFEGNGTDYSENTLDLIHLLIEANIAMEKLDEVAVQVTREIEELDELLAKIKHQDEQLH